MMGTGTKWRPIAMLTLEGLGRRCGLAHLREVCMNSNVKFALAITSSMTFVGPVSAQGAPAAPQAQAQPKDSMSEIVCQKQEVVGGRLATRRVCMTRLQWREQRTLDRQ